MPLRSCSGCTLCCTLLQIPTLGKAANTYCPHCHKHQCRIWGKHPVECKRFLCLWAANPTFPEALRPDVCGALFEPVRGKPIVLVNVDPERPNAWRDGIASALIDKFVAQGTAVAVVVGTESYYRLPPDTAFVPMWRDLVEAARAAGVV